VVVSVVSALVSVFVGLWLSWLWNLPSGASVVLFAAALFFASYLLRTLLPGGKEEDTRRPATGTQDLG